MDWLRGSVERAPQRERCERVAVVLFVVLGILLLVGGHRSLATFSTRGATPASTATSSWLGAAQQTHTIQPIPDSSLPECGNAITLPLGPTICVDPTYWVIHGIAGLFNWLINWVISLLQGFLQGVVAHDILFDTPTAVTSQSPAISMLYDDMRFVANAALVLLVMLLGFNLMAGTQLGMRVTEFKEILPRVLVGVIGANTALWFIDQAIQGTNAFMHFVALAPAAFFVPSLTTPPDAANVEFVQLVGALGIIVYLIFFLFVIFQIFVRLALLDLLIVISPLALICSIAPQTRRGTEWWLSMTTSTLILQPLQLLVVSIGLTLAANLNTQEGFWGLPTVLLQIGILIASLYLALRLSALLNLGLFRTVGAVGNPVGMIVDFAMTVAGLALMGSTAGAAAGAVATTSAGASTGLAPVGPQMPAGGGYGGGGGSAGGSSALPPGNGGFDGDDPGPAGGNWPGLDSGPTDDNHQSLFPDWRDDPRPGAGRIIEGSGFAYPSDGGAL